MQGIGFHKLFNHFLFFQSNKVGILLVFPGNNLAGSTSQQRVFFTVSYYCHQFKFLMNVLETAFILN